ARQPKPFRNLCMESFTPARLAISRTRCDIADRFKGAPVRRDRKGKTRASVLGSSARACRRTGGKGTHWSCALLANSAGRTTRLPSKSTQGAWSEGSQRRHIASDSRSPPHHPQSRNVRQSPSGALPSIFSKASAGTGWGFFLGTLIVGKA